MICPCTLDPMNSKCGVWDDNESMCGCTEIGIFAARRFSSLLIHHHTVPCLHGGTMSLFRKQPGYCCICGKPGHYEYGNSPVICSPVCLTEGSWRNTLYIMGREYYPQPDRPYVPPYDPNNVPRSDGDVRGLEKDQPQRTDHGDGGVFRQPD